MSEPSDPIRRDYRDRPLRRADLGTEPMVHVKAWFDEAADFFRARPDRAMYGNEAALATATREGAPWHVLVYGLYRDAPTARSAIPRLPQRLRRYSPWIRSIESVHAALQN